MVRLIHVAALLAVAVAAGTVGALAQASRPGTAPTAVPAPAPAPVPPPAPTISDMKGTWKGTGDAIVSGLAAHHPPGAPAKSAGSHRLRSQTFTYKIEGQEGKRFWGTVTSESAVEPFIGSISPDGKWVYIAAQQGLLDGTVVDKDTVQFCYRHTSPSTMVVACNEMKRQK